MHNLPEDPDSATYDETDINVFRKVHSSASLSRGRSIVEILHDRSIHGPRAVGGVKSSLEKQQNILRVQYQQLHLSKNPSSCKDSEINSVMDSPHVDGNESVDSLSEVLRDTDQTNTDSLSEVLNEEIRSEESRGENLNSDRIVSSSNASNFNPTEEGQNVLNTTSSSALLLGEDVGFKYNNRNKMNAYPTNVCREIINFVEQQSITQFKADYLSLAKIQALTPQPRISLGFGSSVGLSSSFDNGIPNRTCEVQHQQSLSRNVSYRRREDAEGTESAVSTISIAFSPDGRTLASTHGDHTVKISCCNTGTLIRSLEGHPRTPWTVKYHPTQPNIVASGCLGYQVRLWDWNHPIGSPSKSSSSSLISSICIGDDGCDDKRFNYHENKWVCLKMIRLRNSIISLSFHPTGSVLAIASGHSLHLWVYDNDSTNAMKSNDENMTNYDSRSTTIPANRNNSRPDHVLSSNNNNDESSENGRMNNNDNSNQSQPTSQTVLHQIRYANNLRCVHFPPGGDTIIIGGVNPSSDSTTNGTETSYSLLLLDFDLDVALMSPNEFNYFQSIDPSDRRPSPRVEVLRNYRTLLPRALLYNDGGFDVSSDGRMLCGCAELWLPMDVNSAADLIEKEETERIAVMEHSFHVSTADDAMEEIPSSPMELKDESKRHNAHCNDNSDYNENSCEHKKKEGKKRKDIDRIDTTITLSSESLSEPLMNQSHSQNSPPSQGTLGRLLAVSDCQTPPNPHRPDPTSPPSPPGRRWVSDFHSGRRRDREPRTNRTRSRTQGREVGCDGNSGSNSSRNINGFTSRPTQASSHRRSRHSQESVRGRYVPHVVVVSLDNENGTLGKVLEATPLGSKASSVTCVKFSPSSEFCLLGYGVREQGQNPYGLPFHPVSALYRIRGGMTQIATMLSGDDDVNIARFHPESGVGFVYGTKQGRVRVLGPRPWNYYYD